MKTILVATDFSSSGLNAANYATDMAFAIKARLLLLYVYQLPVSYGEGSLPINEGDFMQNAEKRIKDLQSQLSSRTGSKVNIDTEVRMGIYFRSELETVCEEVKPYIVVMGSQGTTTTERVFFGSQTIFAMKHLMWPLIVVPIGVNFCSIKKIGLASDFNNVLLTTPLDEIKLLVHDLNAELHVLNIIKNHANGSDVDNETDLLKKMLSPLNPRYHFITSVYVDEAIMNFAEKNKIDLLIVLPKRHGLMDKLIHKSHTKQMVLHCHVPVMALHQQW